jgi:hypothetical protein
MIGVESLSLSCVAQAGLKLILLPLPLKCWDYRLEPPYLALKMKFLRSNDKRLVKQMLGRSL